MIHARKSLLQYIPSVCTALLLVDVSTCNEYSIRIILWRRAPQCRCRRGAAAAAIISVFVRFTTSRHDGLIGKLRTDSIQSIQLQTKIPQKAIVTRDKSINIDGERRGDGDPPPSQREELHVRTYILFMVHVRTL